MWTFRRGQPLDQAERDRVLFNGQVMSEFPGNLEFLTGYNNIWKLNSFTIPIEWINLPEDPGEDGTPPTPASNMIDRLAGSRIQLRGTVTVQAHHVRSSHSVNWATLSNPTTASPSASSWS